MPCCGKLAATVDSPYLAECKTAALWLVVLRCWRSTESGLRVLPPSPLLAVSGASRVPTARTS